MGTRSTVRRGTGIVHVSPKSDATVAISEETRTELNRLFGRTLSDDDIANLAGAHRGDEVRVAIRGNSVTFRHGDNRIVIRTRGDTAIVQNLSTRPRRFARTLGILQQLGFNQAVVRTRRTRRDTSYYDAALVGFDAVLPRGVKLGRLRDRLRGQQTPDFVRRARTISDLMRSKEGRAWWRENGVGLRMQFNLRQGSRSVRRLNRYLERTQNRD